MVALAVALGGQPRVAQAVPGAAHWPAGQRELVVVDHTGDAAWEQATRHAVAAWNGSGSPVRLTWARGEGPCRPDGSRVSVCEATYRALVRAGVPGLEGLTSPLVAGGHYRSAVVRLCSNCRLDPARRRVVATHELGHVLGLDHSQDPTSVMHPVGGAEVPTEADVAALRQRYDHAD